MRKFVCLLFVAIFINSPFSPPLDAGSQPPGVSWGHGPDVSENTKYFVLENGLRVFLHARSNIPIVNIVAAVNLGSKDETEETNGLVHLLEHYILFRGTEFRSGSQVALDIRRHGAYFNAHTSQDLAIFEISLPSEHADFGLHNQKEILFHLEIAQREIDAEKEVILEELNQLQDDPIKYATSLVYQNLFPGHPYGKPVYGSPEVIKAATAEKLEAFYRRYFVPNNCSLAVVGNFGLQEMGEKVRRVFGEVKKEDFSLPQFDKASFLAKGVEIVHEMDVNQAYLVLGAVGPDYNHPDQYAIDVLTEILGRGINPLLNTILRGRRELVQRTSMNYLAHKYGGVLIIYFTLDPRNLTAAKREAIGFLKRARNENYSKEDYLGEQQYYAYDYLQSAKNQIKFYNYQTQEIGLSLAQSLAQFILLSDSLERGSYLENVEKITSSELRKVAARYFSKGQFVTVSIIPKKLSRHCP